MTIKTLIVDDHGAVRLGLAWILGKAKGIQVVGTAANGKEAVRLTRELNPDVVVMDVVMSGLSGIEATRKIKKQQPNIKILPYSGHCKKYMVKDMLKAGASGYVLKQCDNTNLVDAIKQVHANEYYLSPEIMHAMAKEGTLKANGDSNSQDPDLTARERQVIKLVSDNLVDKEIAMCLKMTVNTVKTYLKRIRKKLKLQSRVSLAIYALEAGIAVPKQQL